MKICHKCKKEIEENIFVSRQSQCPSCGSDLRCCLNCSFYNTGTYNNCLEIQAERVLDKTSFNFCDFFKFIQISKSLNATGSGTKDKLERLFKKNSE